MEEDILNGLKHLSEHVQGVGVDIGYEDIDIEGMEIIQEQLEADAAAMGTYIRIAKRRSIR